MAGVDHRATLSCDGPYTSFSFGSQCIRFRTPKALKRYLRVKTWDKGYLVVEVEYDGEPRPTEEYIDLVPILENLHLDSETLLTPIKEVVVA